MKRRLELNDYFENRRAKDPDSILKILTYRKRRRRFPFRYNGDNWAYDLICEHQRHYGVIDGQHLTPDAVAIKMAWLARWYGQGEKHVLEACCGTGQITKELLKHGFTVTAFDNEITMTEIHQYLYPMCYAAIIDFRCFDQVEMPLIVSSPPPDEEILTEFIDWLVRSLTPGGRAVLLLPDRYVDSEQPEILAANLSRLKILDRSRSKENFVHTDAVFEIVVAEKAEE